MYKILLLALFCLTIVSAQKGNKKLWWTETKSLLLKSNTFLEHVGKEKIVIVQFIAQFSRECQALLPEWDKLALMYQGDHPKRNDVSVALIDGWTFNSISQSYGVTAFPSIIIFKKGDAQTQTIYKGEKKAEQMSEWIEQFANGLIPADAPVIPNPNGAAPTDANPNPSITQPPADANPPPAQDAQQQQQPPQEPQAATPSPPVNNAQPPADTNPPPAQPVQEPPVVQQAPPTPQQPLEPREVNVVLNTSLLQTQFEELQRHTTTLNEALQRSINDNFHRFEGLKGIMETQKEDLTRVGNNVLSHIQKFDEVKQSLQNQKNDIHKSVTDHTKQQIDELKTAIQQIKAKVSEHRVEEPKEAGFASATVMFLVGGLVGAAVTFVVVSASGGKNKRKLLID